MFKKVLIAFLVFITALLGCTPVYAEETSSPKEETTAVQKEEPKPEEEKKEGKWVLKKHYYYYVDENGRVKGKQEINGKTYYFDKKGRQRTGWRKIGKYYYYFNPKKGKKGYMLKGKTVNKIKLKKSGKAVITDDNKKRMAVLIEANKIVEKAALPDMKIREKLRACFDYTIDHYAYRGDPKFHHSSDWEVDYAYRMMTEYHGSCYEYGAWFAFIAKACGCKESIAVTSGGHGWTEVNGKVCDLSWHQVDSHDYYMMDMDLSGYGGRPNYKKYGYYKKVI